MKTYTEIKSDISNILTENYPDVGGTQLDILVGILSSYAYEVQSTALSMLLENDVNTAINVNSLLSKAAQFGVTIPRVVNPEIEVEVKSIGNKLTIQPGYKLFSISKYIFLYKGYYDNDILKEDVCELGPINPTKVRCVISTDVTNRTFTKISDLDQVIYKSKVPSQLFVSKFTDSDSNETVVRVHNSYIDYISDIKDDNSKIQAVTYVDYSVKLVDEFKSESTLYNIVLPTEITSVNEIVPLLKGKIATSEVTVSEFRSDGVTKNIELFLGSDKLQKSELVEYINNNIKSSQLIKSNSDIIAYFSNLIYNLTGSRYEISYQFVSNSHSTTRELVIYIANQLVNINAINTYIDKSGIINKVFILLNDLRVDRGTRVTVQVGIKMNNSISSEVKDIITGYVSEYDNKFNTKIDEFDLISKINSIDEYLKLTEFTIDYLVGDELEEFPSPKSYLVTSISWK